MQDSKTLLDKAQQQLASSQPTQTEAGQTASSSDKAAGIDAINQVFAEFGLVYHNQFTKAFPTVEKLQYAKQLWYSNLKEYSAQQILDAAHLAIKNSEFLPTVRGLLKYCENEYRLYGLVEPRTAYIEACNAPSPKANVRWSHPAVYYAGLASNWFFLANNIESIAFPVFAGHYEKYCNQVRQGTELTAPETKAIENHSNIHLSQEEQLDKIHTLRKQLKL